MTISVVIPGFNAAKTLDACLKSVFSMQPAADEVIVVDDGSVDDTGRIALGYGAKVVAHETNRGLPGARQSGLKAATGDIILYLDSDVICQRNTVEIVTEYFARNPGIDAVTGMLSEEHPHANIWTCYKNIAMHYNFISLPERVTFLYGAVFSLKRLRALDFDADIPFHGEDTAYGQKMHRGGRQLGFCPLLRVSHLHKHSARSAIKDSFYTSKRISELFWINKGWRRSAGNRGSFASAPRSLLISIALVWIMLNQIFILPAIQGYVWVLPLTLAIWFLLNGSFFSYCFLKERFLVALLCPIIAFVDQIFRGLGIMAGTASYLSKRN